MLSTSPITSSNQCTSRYRVEKIILRLKNSQINLNALFFFLKTDQKIANTTDVHYLFGQFNQF